MKAEFGVNITEINSDCWAVDYTNNNQKIRGSGGFNTKNDAIKYAIRELDIRKEMEA